MIRSLTVLILSVLVSVTGHADQEASWSCTGKEVKLLSKTNYFGEDTKSTQTLYALSAVDSTNDIRSAFFLIVEEDIGRGGTLVLTGTNEVGGSFQYRGSFPKDESDDTVIRRTSSGILSYSHGPLKGDDAVNCVFE